MPLGRRPRRSDDEDTEINMVPIMNMFLVLIPFLLMSASFLHLKAINTSVPVQAERTAEPASEPAVKVTVVVEIQRKQLRVSALSDAPEAGDLGGLSRSIARDRDGAYPFEELAGHLAGIKQRYPASDTMLVIPENSVLYETIIQAMDVGRRSGDDVLFPNVVLTGKVG